MAQGSIAQWLETQCSLLQGALAGVVLSETDSKDLSILAAYPPNAADLTILGAAAKLAIQHGKPVIHAPANNTDDNSDALTIAHPVTMKNGEAGAAAFIVQGTDPEAAKQTVTKLQQGLPWLGTLSNSPCEESSSLHLKLGKLTRLIAAVLTPEKFSAATTALTTELSAELNCERVFLGMVRSRKTRLESISRTAEMSPHGSFTQAVAAAMDEANDQKCSISYPPVASATASLSASMKHNDLRTQYKFGNICTVPLIADDQVVGSLLLERAEENSFSVEELELYEQISSFIAPILKLKYRTGKPLLSRMREKVSRWKRWLFSDQNVSWKFASIVFLATLTTVSLLPVAYEVTTTSRLEGSVQRSIPAPEKGYIKSVFVRPGDHVKTDQLLIELEDRDLKLQQEKARNEISKLKSSYGKALATGDRSELAVIQAGIAEAEANLAYVDQQLERTRLTSPFDGIVLEGDLTQSLGAPIQQGDNLMVLSPSKNFRIILEAEQQDIEKITLGQSGRIAFSANPSNYYKIVVNRISPVAKTLNGKNVFEIEAGFNEDHSAQLRPGFEGLAKLYVDDRPLFKIGYQKARNWIKFHLWRWTGMV